MTINQSEQRRAAYVSLWIFALALGWIEGSVVIYLREIYVRQLDVTGFQFPVRFMSDRLIAVEIAREACSLLVLVAVAWLAGHRRADRAGAFLLVFGLWDLTYYGVLRLVLGWPEDLFTWDILFLIPVPWVAPVWAPGIVAATLVAVGSYLFWTSERSRHYGWKDFGVLLVSTLAVIAALLTEWRVVPDQRIPEHFPVWLFFAGALCGLLWFLRVEYRVSLYHALDSRQPLPNPTVQERLGSWWPQASPVGRVVSDYATARQQLDVLLKEASDLGRRFERLGQALSGHPTRTIIGAREHVDNPSEWDVVPRELLPTIEGVMTLADDIRHTAQLVEDLRERLILMGRADLVQQPGEFFR